MRRAVVVGAVLCAARAAAGQADANRQGLQLRRVVQHSIRWDQSPVAVPAEAVRVYVHEGEAAGAWVRPDTIAVDFGNSGVLFDRKTGQFARRVTLADGWPQRRPPEFPPSSRRPGRRDPHLVGPGILESWRPPSEANAEPTHTPAVSIEFGGRVWQAMQPVGFLQSLPDRAGDRNGRSELRRLFGAWTGILNVANAESFLECRPASGGGPAVRYTMREGLPSNLITHLAAAGGKLWAACVDIYDPNREQWGPGGLACLDPAAGKWSRVETIGGRPVRWVTLLQTEGEDLWVGFREGGGVAGDSVMYGMGLYPGQYRPIATAVTLARLSGGTWTVFSRRPLRPVARAGGGEPDGPSPAPMVEAPPDPNDPPKETPRSLAIVGGRVFLLSQWQSRARGNWDVDWDGQLSLLDPTTGAWTAFDTERDLGAYRLDRIIAERGELLAMTDRGVRRWIDKEARWAALDPRSPLVNPAISAVAAVGGQLWVGYQNQSFGVVGRQGISRFDEETLAWSYVEPNQIGTACPVRAIAPGAEGEAWVLFRQREWHGAAAEYPLYAGEPRGAPGLARFAGGKWEFPARLDGVPQSIARRRQGPNGPEQWEQKLEIEHLVAAGGKLFVSNAAGVYEGPGTWRRIAEPNEREWQVLRASPDGRSLEIWREGRRTDYDPATGRMTDANISHEDLRMVAWYGGTPGDDRLRQSWTEVPTRKGGSWALGELDDGDHRVVQTPRAVWIVSTGQLIRLDRRRLAEWFGDGE